MSEYTEVERPFLQQLAELGWAVIDQGTGRLHLERHESLFLRRHLRHRKVEQALPIGVAAEQFALPPDRSGLQRITLGFGHLRQDPLIGSERGTGNQGLSQQRHSEHQATSHHEHHTQ